MKKQLPLVRLRLLESTELRFSKSKGTPYARLQFAGGYIALRFDAVNWAAEVGKYFWVETTVVKRPEYGAWERNRLVVWEGSGYGMLCTADQDAGWGTIGDNRGDGASALGSDISETGRQSNSSGAKTIASGDSQAFSKKDSFWDRVCRALQLGRR